ncbi:MAG: hypothetical protein RMY62_027995, partial [Nostoc sp. ZfuVER08]|nr:hypothetical protein [Nostoc sp. ZfuVER08]
MVTANSVIPFLCGAAPNFLSFFVSFSDETLRECALCGSLRQAARRLPSSYSLAHLHTELVSKFRSDRTTHNFT